MPHAVKLARLVARQSGDEKPAVRIMGYDSIGRQQFQRLADRYAAGAEFLGQFRLPKVNSGGPDPARDQIANLLRNIDWKSRSAFCFGRFLLQEALPFVDPG